MIIIKKDVFKRRSWFGRNPHLVCILPSVIIMGLLVIIPTVFLYYLSLTNYELGSNWSNVKMVGFANFKRLFSGRDPEFWNSIKLSVVFMVIATSLELVLGFFVAFLLNREFKFKNIVFACLIVPIAMTPSIAGQIWKLMYNAEFGVINYILKIIFNLKISWLSPEFAFTSIIITDIWQWTPFMTLIIYAGLRSIPLDPYESAQVDGGNAIQVFRYITLPLLKPLLLVAIIFRAIDSLRLFDVPFVLTQGGPGSATELLSLHVYRLGFAQTGWIGRASACAIVLLVLTILFSQILIRYMRKGDEEN